MAYVRKTVDEFIIQGNYFIYGWENIGCCSTAKEARKELASFRENEPRYKYRMIKKRVAKVI